jgi:oligopeptidase A
MDPSNVAAAAAAAAAAASWQGDAPCAYFYLDPYSRPAEKREGAWMEEVSRLKLRQKIRMLARTVLCSLEEHPWPPPFAK